MKPAEARHMGGAAASSRSSLIWLNASGLEDGSAIPGTQGVDYVQPTCAEIAYYHSKNLNTIRLPFLWERLQPTLGATLDPTYLGYIQNVVTCAAGYGMTVLLDVHNYGAYNYNGTNGKINGVGGPTITQFANLWSRLATAFVGQNVLYDLMNEPNTMPSAATVPSMYQAAVTAIRLVDTVTPIYLEGDGYASAYGWLGTCANCGGAPTGGWAAGGNDDLRTVVDPNNHIVFEAHAYGDYNNSGSYPIYPNSTAVAAGCLSSDDTYQCAQKMGDQLTTPTSTLSSTTPVVNGYGGILVKRVSTNFATWCGQYSLSCAVLESGVPNDDTNWLTALNNEISYLQSKNITFGYWNAGPNSVGYALGVEPSNLGLANQEDTVQMAVLTKYSNAYQPTNYFISGPQRGTASVASTAFTYTYRGNVPPSSIVLTPNDNGASGTFAPTSVTCSAGFNCSGTFTYTAIGTSVYQISSTNSNGLTNPAAIGYATVADEFSSNGISDSQIWSDCSTHKNYAPYIGPAFTLRRSSDNALQTFYFSSNALGSTIDQTAVSTWLNGANAFVATCYDQSPSGNNWVVANDPAHGINPSNADQPQLILNDKNGLPAMRLASSAMMVPTPINGSTSMTTVLAYEPTGYGSHEGTGPINWNFNCCGTSVASAYSSDTFQESGGAARSFTQDNTWTVSGGTYAGGVTDGTFMNTNGALVGKNTSSATPYSSFTTYGQIGWQIFTGSTTSADISGAIVLGTGLPQTSLANIVSTEQTALAIGTSFPVYNNYSPTLNQSTTLANTLPWEGINQSGMEFGGGPFYPTAAGATFWAGLGSNIVRDPIAWEYIQPTLGAALSATVLSNLQTVVANQNAAGMDAIIDIHNYCQYNGKLIGASGGPTQANYVDLMTRLATAFASNPKVQFDLMNEPGCTSTVMLAAAQAAITAIRGVESVVHYIHYEDPAFQCYAVSGTSGAHFLTLTGTKLILQCHEYWDSNNSGSTDYAANNAWQNLQSATTYAQANNVPLFLGEFGMGFTPSNYAQNKAALEYIAANLNSGSGGWNGWTAWGAGPAWTESYPLLIEPRDFNAPQVYRPMDNLFNAEVTGHVWPATQTFTNCYTSPTASCTVQFP